MGEEWRSIEGYRGIYEVSSMGRVRSLDRVLTNGHHRRGINLKPIPNDEGYLSVVLCWDGDRHMRKVHSLVCEAFIGPRPEGLVIDHINHKPDDNRVSNLEYVTHAENIRRSFSDGCINRHTGEGNPNAKIGWKDVKEIRRLHKDGAPVPDLASRFSISRSQVYNVVNLVSWNHENHERAS